jgi:hypothetical protein
MDINQIYDRIVNELKALNSLNIIVELEDSISGAASGSEALMSSASYLKSLKESNPEIYGSLKSLINEYLDYCKVNGLLIR